MQNNLSWKIPSENRSTSGSGITFDGTISIGQLAIRSAASTVGGYGAFAGAIPYIGLDTTTASANTFFNFSPTTGNFGLGLATPLYKLDVVGPVRLNGNFGAFNTTPVAQQAGGAATAGAVYTATEQEMLQKAYDALRAYGFLS